MSPKRSVTVTERSVAFSMVGRERRQHRKWPSFFGEKITERFLHSSSPFRSFCASSSIDCSRCRARNETSPTASREIVRKIVGNGTERPRYSPIDASKWKAGLFFFCWWWWGGGFGFPSNDPGIRRFPFKSKVARFEVNYERFDSWSRRRFFFFSSDRPGRCRRRCSVKPR